jgi:hypothetical protein
MLDMLRSLKRKGKMKVDLESYNLDISVGDDLPLTFIAASVEVNENGYLYHAGIAIGCEHGKHLFHYDGSNLRFDLLEFPWHLQHTIDLVPEYLAEAFYVHCYEATLETAPEYGFFYEGTYFKDGKAVLKNEANPYRMSCVGFCLALLKGWDKELTDYMEYKDWKADNTLKKEDIDAEMEELKYFYPKLTEEELLQEVRRIKPSEYLAASYFKTYPVRKAQTDTLAVGLKEVALKFRPPIEDKGKQKTKS